MKTFITINGIDLFYSDLIIEDGIETVTVKAKSLNSISKDTNIAIFKIPNCTLIENSGFEDRTIQYLLNILSNIENTILDDAKKDQKNVSVEASE